MPRVYQVIAKSLQAKINCGVSGNSEWHERHYQTILETVREKLPSGSGFDRGTQFDFEKSTPEKLVFNTAFHHMDDDGGYCGWSEHKVIVTPSLCFDFDIRVTGKNVRDIKDYIFDVFSSALDEMIEE